LGNSKPGTLGLVFLKSLKDFQAPLNKSTFFLADSQKKAAPRKYKIHNLLQIALKKSKIKPKEKSYSENRCLCIFYFLNSHNPYLYLNLHQNLKFLKLKTGIEPDYL
jgi:hypothetical protein